MSKFKLLSVILLLPLLLVGCSANDPIDEPVYFTTIHSDQIYLGGAQLLIPAYAEIYNTVSQDVECITANTYYLVSGNTTTGEIKGFTDNGRGRITYTDITPNRAVLITTALAVFLPPEDGPAIVSSKIFLNGMADDASFIAEYLSNEDPADALPIMCLMNLQPNDYIDIRVASTVDNVTVTVYNMTLVATTVD